MTHTSDKTIIVHDDSFKLAKLKKSLIQTIEKKRNILLSITAKVEMLRLDLDIIKREYHVRIGRLYLKDDQLDLEIIRYKNIKSLLESGMSYDKAIEKINEQYYAEKKLFDFRDEEIAYDEKLLSMRKDVEESTQEDIKKLWKKLLFQLHPDLTKNPEEKKQREGIMRKINDAYAQNDFDTLKTIENQHTEEDFAIASVERLEQRIAELEDAAITQEIEYQTLLSSEWYMWRKKSQAAQKKNSDIFKELEEKLLEDVTRKIYIVQVYRKEFDEKGYY
ncbi:MAG: hypothetical protein KBD46_01465 [Candidatus Levybacteria bacterium]|nr:hypothetical protein [Candidatus Levybacteria bacterium]